MMAACCHHWPFLQGTEEHLICEVKDESAREDCDAVESEK